MANDSSAQDEWKEAREKKRKATLAQLSTISAAANFIDLDDWQPDPNKKHVDTAVETGIKQEDGIAPTTSPTPDLKEQTSALPKAVSPAPVSHEDGVMFKTEPDTTPGSKEQNSTSLTAVPAAPVNHEDGSTTSTEPHTIPDPKEHIGLHPTAPGSTAQDLTAQNIPAPQSTSNPVASPSGDETPAPKTPENTETILNTNFKPATAEAVAEEPQAPREHNTKDDAVVLDVDGNDDDDVVVVATKSRAPRSESGLLTPEGGSSTSDVAARPLASGPAPDAMDIDEVSQQDPAPQEGGASSPTGDVASPSEIPTDGGSQERRGPADRVTTTTYRSKLQSMMRQVAANRAAAPAVTKPAPATKVAAAKVIQKPRHTRPTSENELQSSQGSSAGNAKPGTVKDTGAPKEGKAASRETQGQTSGGGGDPDPGDHDDSSEDDGENGNESDGGLFVNDSKHSSDRDDDDDDDEDVDVEMEDESEQQRAEREELEFEALKDRFKKAERKIKKLRKQSEDDEADMLAEVKFIEVKKHYDVAVQKRKMMEERERLENGDDEEMNDAESVFNDRGCGYGGGDVPDDMLFDNFETRQQPEQPLQEESDGDDVMAGFDGEAQQKLARSATQAPQNNGSDDEGLVGKRTRRAASTRRPRKMRGEGPATSRKKTPKPANDRVQDKKAKVGKDGKKKKKPVASLTNPHFNVESLWTGDVIRDAQGNQGLSSLPVHTSGNRKTALATLVASLPEELRLNAQSDKKAIISAMGDFNWNRAVHTRVGGQYYIRGMASQLQAHQLLGTAFMRRRERDSVGPPSGICADQMGLGSESRSS